MVSSLRRMDRHLKRTGGADRQVELGGAGLKNRYLTPIAVRIWGSGALRYLKSEERTPLERVIANKLGGNLRYLPKTGFRGSTRKQVLLSPAEELARVR